MSAPEALAAAKTLEKRATTVRTWFQAQDPHAHQRDELQAAGVPQRTVERLYPRKFDALLANLTAHFAAVDFRMGTTAAILTAAPKLDLAMMYSNLTRAQQEACAATLQDLNDPAWGELTASLLPHFAEGPRAELAANVAITYLHYMWWALTHLGELYIVPRVQAETLACWCGKYLLRLPEFTTQTL